MPVVKLTKKECEFVSHACTYFSEDLNSQHIPQCGKKRFTLKNMEKLQKKVATKNRVSEWKSQEYADFLLRRKKKLEAEKCRQTKPSE